MMKLKLLLCSAGVLGMLGTVGFLPLKESIKETEDRLVQRYVRKQYLPMYNAHPLRQGTTIPELTFDESMVNAEVFPPFGLYVRSGNFLKIYISPRQCAPEAEGNPLELLAHKIRQFRCYAFADKTLNHELAHHFVAERAQSRGLAQLTSGHDYLQMSMLRLTGAETTERYNVVARTMVSEGIAEYYSKDHSHIASFVPRRLPQMYGSDLYAEYSAGLSLVTPILDKFGPRGIDMMLEHPPVVTTLDDLIVWREKILGGE